MPAPADLIEQFKKAFCAGDAVSCAELLDRHPELKADINEPVGPFDSPLITNVRTREMLDVLLAAGADINARSRWWAGGFGLLDVAKPELAAYAIQRGAMVDVHSAARLGMIDKLREFISAKPELINARGGDGQTPLHFANTVDIARYLLDHGAGINARDIDHESTPAQYMVRDRQEVVRFLIERGCETDLLMASAIGDAKLVHQHLERNPDSIRVCVNEAYFPKANPRSGGTIYKWTLGSNVSAHDVAKEFKHDDIFRLLMDHSPPDVRLLAACWSGDEVAVKSLLESQPDLATSLADAHGRQLADAARNNNVPAVRLMLAAGFPVNALGQHGAIPLHWAGFHGNLEMTNEILRHHPALELKDADFKLPPLGWAVYGSENGWYCKTGDYAGTVEAMLNAGAKPPEKLSGTHSVKEVLRKWRVNESD